MARQSKLAPVVALSSGTVPLASHASSSSSNRMYVRPAGSRGGEDPIKFFLLDSDTNYLCLLKFYWLILNLTIKLNFYKFSGSFSNVFCQKLKQNFFLKYFIAFSTTKIFWKKLKWHLFILCQQDSDLAKKYGTELNYEISRILYIYIYKWYWCFLYRATQEGSRFCQIRPRIWHDLNLHPNPATLPVRPIQYKRPSAIMSG